MSTYIIKMWCFFLHVRILEKTNIKLEKGLTLGKGYVIITLTRKPNKKLEKRNQEVKK